ncbi:MAG: NYN domain-containing protein, partial [bacterium]
MAENEVRRIAVLIDADNTSLGVLEEVLTELSLRGRIIVKRAYGNWKKEELKNWPDEINKLAIRAMQQFDYVAGKNATDIALVIDALDLLYTGNYDAFALVSSDSDYTPLAIRLHECVQLRGRFRCKEVEKANRLSPRVPEAKFLFTRVGRDDVFLAAKQTVVPLWSTWR